MIIIGAKGFAKEILFVLEQLKDTCFDELYFYDDVSTEIEYIFKKYKVLRSIAEIKTIHEVKFDFVLGIGGTSVRELLTKKMLDAGGILRSVISPFSQIGNHNEIGEGVSIMGNVIITNSVTIGQGTLLNLNATIGHDSVIGRYCDIMPGVNISGNCTIGDYCAIGTNAAILPNITIGNNAKVGAGAVVTKDVSSGQTVVGIPAKPL